MKFPYAVIIVKHINFIQYIWNTSFFRQLLQFLSRRRTLFPSPQISLGQDIRKMDGYDASHLLFILSLLPILKIPTIHSFCLKNWYHWCMARKDAFFRFPRNPFRWRSFMYAIIFKISEKIDFEKIPLRERYFVIDDSPIPKRGRSIENVSLIYDHSALKVGGVF